MFNTIENRVQLIGYLGTEIEVKTYAEGKKIARMSLATTEVRKNDEGKKEHITTWHNLVAWGRDAEVMGKTFSKGQRMFIEGKLSYREYENHLGGKGTITELVITEFRKLERE